MSIRVSTPGGATIEFPEGTDAETISKVMAQATGGAAKPQSMGTLEAGARGVAQGVTFGFADELYGAGKGVASAVTGGGFSDAYAQGRDEMRASNKQAADQNPIAYYGGQVVGGVAVPFGAARVGAAAARAAPGLMAPVANAGRVAGFGQLSANAGGTLGARTLAGAREGVAYGAVAGFGEGEGGVAERALNSGRGALFGGAVGAAVPGLVDAGAAVARGVTTPFRAVMQPQAVGREKLAEALMRDVSGEGGAQPGYGAAFDRLTSRLDAGQQAGKNLMLADVGGENTRNLLRAAGNQQSTGAERLRKTLDTRQGNQWSRIESDLADTMGDGKSFYQSVDDLVAKRKANAKPAFDGPNGAYNQPWNVKGDDPLVTFLTDRSYMRRLVEKTMENVEGMTGNNPAAMKPWEFLHRVKFQIDREISALKKGQQDSKASWDLGDLVALKKEFLGHIDTHNKPFGRALAKYGDDSSLITAAEDGFESALKLPVEELRKQLGKLNTQEAELYRVGAARAIIDKVRQGNVTRDRTENIFSSPDIQMRLRALMPDQQSYREFQRSLVLEAKMADTRKAVQGNSTTAKQLAQADEAGQPMRMAVGVAQAATGRFEPALNLLGRTAQRFSGITPATANEIISAAMERDPVAVRRALQTAMRTAGNASAARAQVAQEIMAGATSASE